MKGYFYNFGRGLLVFCCNSCGWCPSCMKWNQTDAVSCFILMESDHLGEYSPENECSWWWLTFWQPIWKSESSVLGGVFRVSWLRRRFLRRLSKRQLPPTAVHLRITLTWIIRISLMVCHPGFKPFSVLILMVSYFFQFCCTAVLGKENKVDKQIKKGEML